MNPQFSRESELLYKGDQIPGGGPRPESIPCYLTTAFVMENLSEVQQVTREGGYTYIRKSNPNRTALAEAVSYLEGGEESLIFASGMGAIYTVFLTLLEPGDHIVCNTDIYGEVFEIMEKIMPKMQVEVSFVDLRDLDAVRAAMRPETKLIYTEVVSNPVLALADIGALADIAHAGDGYLMVDNTFTTPLAIRPIEFGADFVVNSLTKFLNGHSDAMGGSLTASREWCARILPMSMLCGTPGDPFSSWLILRGLHTVELRVPRQMESAAILAQALRQNRHVKAVHHPSLPDYPQQALADRLFSDKGFCAMLSFEVAEDPERIDQLMDRLHLARYAPTLGGIRTTLSHPVTSSHYNVPDDVRRRRGITPGLVRVSVGIERADDLVRDFLEALKVFD